MNIPEIDGAIQLTSKLADSINDITDELKDIRAILVEYQQFLADELKRIEDE